METRSSGSSRARTRSGWSGSTPARGCRSCRCHETSRGRSPDKASKLINIFANNTASDIHATSALRRLVQVMLGVTDKPIKQVKFHGRLGPSFVYASRLQIQAALRQFLYQRPEKGPLAKQRKR